MPLKKRIAKILDSMGLLRIAYSILLLTRGGAGPRSVKRLAKNLGTSLNRVFSSRRGAISKISKGRILLRQGLEEQGLSNLVILAYGPNVKKSMRRKALAELLTWGVTANETPIAELAAKHLVGGFGSTAVKANHSSENTALLEHYSKPENWSQAIGYREFIRASSIRRNKYEFATANFAFGMPVEIFGSKVVRELQIYWLDFILDAHSLSGFNHDGESQPLTIDDLPNINQNTNKVSDGPLVSVLMPVFNGEEFLDTALEGLASQTYQNIEVLVVDDCSTDNTAEIVKRWNSKDSRFQLISAGINGGSYRARNIGLEQATGEYVTVHDADDWSHPQKIQLQVEQLQKYSDLVGNVSQGVRVKHDRLHFYPVVGRNYLRMNISSMMFRRALVAKEIGYWDEVRFGADSEFHERIMAKFGTKSVSVLNAGPLSFTRFHAASLTGGGYASTQKGITGIRRFYSDSFKVWHGQISRAKASAYLGRESAGRPFEVAALHVDRNAKYEKFDLVIAADLSATGKMLAAVEAEIAAAKTSGQSIGLVHLIDPAVPVPNYAPSLQAAVDFKLVSGLFDGDVVETKLLKVLQPKLWQQSTLRRAVISADATESFKQVI